MGVTSEQWGQKVAAVVVLDPAHTQTGRGGKTWGVMDMRRALKDKLAGYKIPQELKTIEELPKNAMGKSTYFHPPTHPPSLPVRPDGVKSQQEKPSQGDIWGSSIIQQLPPKRGYNIRFLYNKSKSFTNIPSSLICPYTTVSHMPPIHT